MKENWKLLKCGVRGGEERRRNRRLKRQLWRGWLKKSGSINREVAATLPSSISVKMKYNAYAWREEAAWLTCDGSDLSLPVSQAQTPLNDQ